MEAMSRLIHVYTRLAFEYGPRAYLFALLCVALAVLVRFALGLWAGPVVPFATLFPAILLAAMLGGPKPGALALASATLTGWYLFLPPTFSLALPDRANQVSVALFVIAGGLVLLFGATLRIAVERYSEAVQQAEASERRLRLALDAGRLGTAWFDAVRRVGGWSEAVARMLGLPAAQREVTYEQWLAIVLPEDRSLAEAALQDALAHPDGYYQAEYRIRRPSGEVRTLEFRGTVMRDDEGRAVRLEGVAGDVTERARHEQRQRELLHELDHRVRNILTVVQALAAQTARTASSLPSFTETFSNRLSALAATHALLTEAQWHGVDLHKVVEAEVMPYQNAGQPRVIIEGAYVTIPAPLVTPIGLVLHELTTNAVKYGALSGEAGTVRVCWTLTTLPEVRLQLTWQEVDGPPVVTPTRSGFGSRLIRRLVQDELKGDARLEYRPDGLLFEVSFPFDSQEALPTKSRS
ncbi:signal transduction histidine kinase [Methylobacterium sp. 4-46]|nr:signal transduction histidine kinase [Methylobacterium sp. 4-46]